MRVVLTAEKSRNKGTVMTEADADLLRRVLAQIRNQRKNLNLGYTDEDDAARFHEQLDRLQQAGHDVEEFRLDPERDMFFRLWSSNYLTGEEQYADKRSITLGVLEAKMDALLDYFELDAGQVPIEFKGPFKR
jgi:hypothetical protein